MNESGWFVKFSLCVVLFFFFHLFVFVKGKANRHNLVSVFSQLNLGFRMCLNLRFTFDILPGILPSQIHSVMHDANHKKRKVNTVTE